MNLKVFPLLFVFFLLGCAQKNLDDYREEGEKFTRQLILELKNIHSKKGLIESKPKLHKLFNDLVETMITAREFHMKHPEIETPEILKKNHELSAKLRVELNRIYKIEGGKELIEKYQEAGLQKLDLFENKNKNKLK